jgi:hypothetical protein
MEKSRPKFFGYFCNFQKMPKVHKQLPNGRKSVQSGHPAQNLHLFRKQQFAPPLFGSLFEAEADLLA